ncbi:hypothetical protein Lalb_Chr16g0381841 [Lupinus albus]|uniref:Uncharacterized protein n=1 Tax=Lupinus albus TaxID=3870 RepID=A0A6A4PBF2_LUPAL|nr:hypothetical protein Lalb_Chr16g0381841 [Lupinus albus]
MIRPRGGPLALDLVIISWTDRICLIYSLILFSSFFFSCDNLFTSLYLCSLYYILFDGCDVLMIIMVIW